MRTSSRLTLTDERTKPMYRGPLHGGPYCFSYFPNPFTYSISRTSRTGVGVGMPSPLS